MSRMKTLPFFHRVVLSLTLVLSVNTLWAAETVWLDQMDLGKMRQGYGKPQMNRSIRETPLTIGGRKFERGVGTHARSTLWIELGGGTERFEGFAGVDDAANGPGSVVFKVFGDGRKLWDSGVMKVGQEAREFALSTEGVKSLLLQVEDGGDGISYDHANWAEARFRVTGSSPRPVSGPREEILLLTPKPGLAPRVNGPSVTGCRPGHPFLYRIPATGARPMRYQASGLPQGLELDKETGIISGRVSMAGEYRLVLRAINEHGRSSKAFRIVCGDRLALTPPMGWNHWYAHYNRVTDRMMREAADAMITSGMADVGYQYVSIDDCWMNTAKSDDPLRVGPFRDAAGQIIPNGHFPDMKALTDFIHARGLKAGIYTSPGPTTCAGFAGSYQHEARDAKQFADWGFDFLKYDWCSYTEVTRGDSSLAALKKPYILMGEILKRQPRDIVFNLCQYGMGEVWEWGAEVGGHSWRTAGDLGFELDRIFEVAVKNIEHRQWSRPGSWNDPDYLQIGYIGAARGMGEPTPCPLTPSEQYSFMSLWCLMAAPLFYSGDMTRLDELTLSVLCNPEMIEVNQDALGQCGRLVRITDETFALIKEMEDGSHAVGLFNPGEMETSCSIRWSDLWLRPAWRARDLWRQQELGPKPEGITVPLARRGCSVVRVWHR